MSVITKFKALAEGAGPNKAWCFIAVPFDAAKLWGTRGRIAVKGTINGFPYRTNIQPMNGRHLLTFNKHLQAGAKASDAAYEVRAHQNAQHQNHVGHYRSSLEG